MNWKIFAIVLLVLFILETAVIVLVFSIGTKMVSQENECMYNVCADYDAFIFDDYNSICYCYENNEITKTEYLG